MNILSINSLDKRLQFKKLKRFYYVKYCTAKKMNRQVGSGAWDYAMSYLLAHPKNTYAVVKNVEAILEDELKNEWCMVVYRKDGKFEQVTYHHGIERDRR